MGIAQTICKQLLSLNLFDYYNSRFFDTSFIAHPITEDAGTSRTTAGLFTLTPDSSSILGVMRALSRKFDQSVSLPHFFSKIYYLGAHIPSPDQNSFLLRVYLVHYHLSLLKFSSSKARVLNVALNRDKGYRCDLTEILACVATWIINCNS